MRGWVGSGVLSCEAMPDDPDCCWAVGCSLVPLCCRPGAAWWVRECGCEWVVGGLLSLLGASVARPELELCGEIVVCPLLPLPPPLIVALAPTPLVLGAALAPARLAWWGADVAARDVPTAEAPAVSGWLLAALPLPLLPGGEGTVAAAESSTGGEGEAGGGA